MHRKDFIKGSCTACLALSSGFLVSALLDSCKTPLGVIKTSAKDRLVTIPLTEFGEADYKLVRVSNYDYDLAIHRKPDSTFHTLVLKCSHAGQPLTKTGNTYYCTLHGSSFSQEGQVLKGPADQNLTVLRTVVLNGVLTVHLV